MSLVVGIVLRGVVSLVDSPADGQGFCEHPLPGHVTRHLVLDPGPDLVPVPGGTGTHVGAPGPGAGEETSLPLEGTVLITIADRDKEKILEFARNFQDMKFNIMATEGTRTFLEKNGIDCEYVKKVHEGRPNIIDAIKNGVIHLVINTPAGKQSEYDDSYIRKSAIKHKVPYITTTSAALAATKGIKDRRNGAYKVKSLQEYHRLIRE